jgi:putative nucleotidyltransferase with HDIG domain
VEDSGSLFLLSREKMKKRLLFVDDDLNILNGLRRVLHHQRDQWDMHFTGSGVEALEIMEAMPFDIVIADIRMPVMDGIQLLENVMSRYPGTVRIILSGHSDSDLIMKSAAVAHQYLCKPCDPEVLKSVIAQAEESRTFLRNENLKCLISKLGVLPSVPMLFCQVAEELHAPEISVSRVGEIISRDPSMAAKVLQLANSPYFGRRHSVSKITDAVAYLGMDRVTQLLLAIHAFAQFKPGESGTFSIEDLWMHSNSTAMRAKRIAEEQHASGQTVDDAFTAGLLHDIGKLVLATRLPEQYSKALMRAAAGQMPLWLAERETFSATHAEVGACLMGTWGLPDHIVDAIAFHHNPLATTGEGFTVLTAVHAADTLEYLADLESIH